MPMFKKMKQKMKLLPKKMKKSDAFSDLVFDGRWVRLLNLLGTAKYQMYLKSECGKFHFHYFNYLSMIHLACMVKAPVSVIIAMVALFPSSVIMADKNHRLPLHIACKYGAEIEVIKFLIEKNPSSLVLQDCDGKIPLHLACEYKNMNPRESEKYFKALIKANPNSLAIMDSNGLSVLEYAQKKNLDIYTVQLIEWESQKLLNNKTLSVIEEESYCSELSSSLILAMSSTGTERYH